jgi:aryl-alcohol dehydrogenase-like predicted oxidoreductase
MVLATKWPRSGDADAVRHSIAVSLERLQTDYVDVMQFSGGMFTPEQPEHILAGGPRNARLEARDAGRIGFLGFTCEDHWTARTLIASRSCSRSYRA